MRDIKFRVWDKEEKRFLTQEEMNEIGGFYYTHGVTVDNHNDRQYKPLMQYTGLKDSKGVEIYEGDIIVTIKNGERIRQYEVDWETSFLMKYGQSMTKGNEFEIIGNIYENKELLKGGIK